MAQEPDFFARQVTAARRFYLDLRTAPAPGLIVACGGWELCSPDYRMARATFPWLGLELVVEGTGRLLLDGREHQLVPGAVFVYGPGIAHEITCTPRRPLRKYFLDLGGKAATALLAEAGLAPGTVAHLARPAHARATLDLLIESGFASGPRAPALCAALAIAAVLSVASGAVEPRCIAEPAYATYLRCRKWLEELGEEVSTLAEAAKACGIGSAYLCRLFRRYDRQTPWQMVRQRRLLLGADLLTGSNLRVSAVAARLGYADGFHFSRAFSKAFGISPQRFRALAR